MSREKFKQIRDWHIAKLQSDAQWKVEDIIAPMDKVNGERKAENLKLWQVAPTPEKNKRP